MFDHLFQKTKERGSIYFEKEPHLPQRNSSEHRGLNPLMDEEGTNECRYYRSAEFQQALLEDQIARKLAPPVEPEEQETGRLSRYLKRRSTMRSSKASLPLFDFEADRAKQAAETEVLPPPAFEAVDVPPSQPIEGSVAAGSTDSSSSARSAHSRKSSRLSVHLKSIGSLIKREGERT